MTVHPDEPLIVLDDDWMLDEPVDDEPLARRPRRRVLFGLVAVAGLLLASVIVTAFDSADSVPDRPDTSGFAAVESGRLPAALTSAWSTRLGGTGNAVGTSLVVEDGLVIAIVDDGSRGRSLVAGVDATTGEQLWRRSYPYRPSEMSPLLVDDGVLVLEQNDRLTSNRLIAISTADGSDRWERRLRGVSLSGVLDGTSLIAHIDRFGPPRTTFFSPVTGEPVGAVNGRATTTDLDGSWYLATGGGLDRIDLAAGWSEPVPAVPLANAGEQRVVPVAGQLITLDATGRLGAVDGDGELTMLRADDVPTIEALWPVGGRAFVAIGNGEVFGLRLLRDAVSLEWRRTGDVRQFGLTDEGLFLVLGSARSADTEGTSWLVVDGATGDELTSFRPQVPGRGAVRFTSNGFVTSPNGSDHEGFDLGGASLWRLDDAGKLAVGDDLVVTLADTPSGFRLTGWD